MTGPNQKKYSGDNLDTGEAREREGTGGGSATFERVIEKATRSQSARSIERLVLNLAMEKNSNRGRHHSKGKRAEAGLGRYPLVCFAVCPLVEGLVSGEVGWSLLWVG